MNPKELRIGNLVQDEDGRVLEVMEIKSRVCAVWVDSDWELLNNELLSPIPLTPEVLGGCNKFTQDHDGKYTYHYHIADVCSIKLTQNSFADDGRWWFSMKSEQYSQPVTIDIYHLHRLQNIIHALTGEELDVEGVKNLEI